MTRPTTRRRLGDHVRLRVVHRDDSRYGSPISERCERELRRRLAVLHGYRARHGLTALVREGARVLDRVLVECLQGIRDHHDRLASEWLYPAPERVQPVALRVERDLDEVLVEHPLPGIFAPSLAGWLGDWQRGASAPRAGEARALWDALDRVGALVTDHETEPARAPAGVRLVGHASLRIADAHTAILVDPFLFPRSARYPADWQPDSHADLMPVDGVLLTHSHPDHFDLATLLRLGAETPIVVPRVERESVLSIDMATRLRGLGFRTVREVEAWEHLTIGTLGVRVLPFTGEQPTVGEQLHPEVRNVGATYLVEAEGHRIAVLADAGRDATGDVCRTAARARALDGDAHLVIGPYRGFALYPVQYAFSSVSRHLAFVPRASFGVRQRVMCDADDLLDVAETWAARRVVPYAAGGAPWHWMVGLGPCLDGSMPDALSTDPPPMRVVDAARRRGATRLDGPLASPVEVVTPRVGDTLTL